MKKDMQMQINPRTAPPQDVVDLESVVCTVELTRRPSRPPDYAAENCALVALAQAMAGSPNCILQKLVETALALCHAHSAGISLLEEDKKKFRWPAIAGQWAAYLGGGTPRDYGPCGTVLDRGVALLFTHPERHFTYLTAATPEIEEALLIPFYVEGKAVGTIWIIAHDQTRRFDAEDLRLMTNLGNFAAAGYQTLLFVAAISKAHQELQQKAESLEVKMIERKRAEAAVRERTAQFETLLDEAPLGVYLVDGDLRIRQVNPTALPVFGNIPDLIGRDFDKVLHILWPKPYADEIVERFRHTLETGEPCMVPERIEERRDRGGCEFYEWQINRIPLPDGGYGVVCYFRDISAQVRAREALRESEERLGGILRQATVGLAQTDLTGRFLLVNDRYCEIVGYPREELLRLRMQDITHPDDLQKNVRLFQQTAQTGEDFVIEKRYVRRDGSLAWVHNNVYAVRNAEGRPEHIVAISLDISDRKRAEDTVRNLNAQLEDRVAQQTAELVETIAQRETLNEQLLHAQKMESVGMLASGVAHDFNNILNLISGYGSLMQQDPNHPETILDSVEAIKDSVKRGASLVQQLLAIGRKNELRFEPVDLNSLIKSLKALLIETFDKKIQISLSLAPELPRVAADPNQINQVLLNLCVNSRDAMPEGGKLSVATGIKSGLQLRRRFHEAMETQYARVSVTDTGDGIDEAINTRIFEPFFTTKESGKGTGLGLSVAYGIVTHHGGLIDVTSKPGQGTTFDIYLPLASDKSGMLGTNSREAAEMQKPAGNGETILFVDDEVRLVTLMRRVLAKRGYRVLTARDGLEAVETYLRHQRDIAVVILDLGLPKLNGWEAFQKIKEANPSVKVILASGYLSEQAEVGLKKKELSGVVMKPYEFDDVLAKISAAIRGKKESVTENEGYFAANSVASVTPGFSRSRPIEP